MKPYLKVILTLALPIAAFIAFMAMPDDVEFFGEKIQKVKLFDDEETVLMENSMVASTPADTADVFQVDTTKKRILLFGDSMVGVLRKHFSNYCSQNGDTLFSAVWYSSGSRHWAKTDTLEHFINLYKPDYLMICLCSNELFRRDLDERDKDIKTIIDKMNRQNLPFIWVSPPNWKKDKGITDLILKNVGASRFFDSRELVLPRISDGAHPTVKGGIMWVDTLTKWLASPQCAYPIRMEKPEKEYKPGAVTHLSPPKS